MKTITHFRLQFEHLMCDAFECKRAEYPFANADHYDNAKNHIEETRAFLLCGLINLKKKKTLHQKEIIEQQIKDLIDIPRTNFNYETLQNIMSELFKKNIVV